MASTLNVERRVQERLSDVYIGKISWDRDGNPGAARLYRCLSVTALATV